MAMPAWVSEVGVAAQVVIAAAAIWGEKIRARLSRPQLRVSLVGGTGDAEPRNVDDRIVTVHYHRLEVRNRTRFSVANEVQVFITRIENREPSGRITTRVGATPLEWQYQDLYESTRNIGYSTVAIANLFFRYSNFTDLTPMIKPVPVNFGDRKTNEQNFWITVVARGLNAESESIRIEVQWDGQEAGHLSVNATPAAPPVSSRH